MTHFLSLILLTSQLLQAQTARNLATNENVTLAPEKYYLFVQDNCEACEKALRNLSRCEDKIKKLFSIVVMQSETWARTLQASGVIKKIQPHQFYLMSFSEAKKMKVFGTPTYLPGLDKKLRPKTCDQLKKEMKL